MNRLLVLVFVAAATLTSSVNAQKYLPVKKGTAECFAKVEDDPKLPRVLVIGDSISMDYTPPLRKAMMGKANVHRIPVNGGPTTRGVENIDKWLGDSNWDVIHFNFGLHDLKKLDKDGKAVDSPEKGEYQVPLDQYEKNLEAIVERLKKTGAKLVWRNTTPVPAGTRFRVEGDAKRYNEVAAKVMKRHGIPTNDLFTYVAKHTKGVQKPRNVHFTKKGSAKLAELVAKSINSALDDKTEEKSDGT